MIVRPRGGVLGGQGRDGGGGLGEHSAGEGGLPACAGR